MTGNGTQFSGRMSKLTFVPGNVMRPIQKTQGTYPYLHDPFSAQLLHNSVLKRIGLELSLNLTEPWSSLAAEIGLPGTESLLEK